MNNYPFPRPTILITPDYRCKSGIYAIHSQANDRWYVGQARSLWDRRLAHLSTLRRNAHSNSHLQRSYLKYGVDSLEFYLLEELASDATDMLLLERENYWIDQFPRKDLINQAIPAGPGTHNLRPESQHKRLENLRHTQNTPEYRQHMSEMAKAQWADPKIRARNAASLAAKVRTPEYRAKMTATHQQMWSDPDFKAKRMAILQSTAHTPEARAKRSEKMRGTKHFAARLSEADVREIRRCSTEKSATYAELAQRFSVSKGQIKNIVTGRAWKHLIEMDLSNIPTVETDHLQQAQLPTVSHLSPDQRG